MPERSVTLERVELDEEHAIPDWRDFDLIVTKSLSR
jgi:hypothetical protein